MTAITVAGVLAEAANEVEAGRVHQIMVAINQAVRWGVAPAGTYAAALMAVRGVIGTSSIPTWEHLRTHAELAAALRQAAEAPAGQPGWDA